MKQVIKSLPIIALIIAMLYSLAVGSFAADLGKDGTYTVNVTLYHAEKEKESTGNKYIVQTALIEVKDGKKYITVVADGVDNLTFSYYLDGSTEGEKAQAAEVKNVEIDGKTYATGFKFPLVTDSSDVGVAFKAPVMPVSPSARLRIDYSSAKLISGAETETGTEAASEEETSETVTQEESKAEASSAVPETTSAAETASAPETAAAAEETAEAENSHTPYAVYAVIGVLILIAAFIPLIVKKAKKKK